jgi:hypothetical protein
VSYKSVTEILYQKTRVLYQTPLSVTNVVDYGVLTIHESNVPFPVTRHQFRMMCDKDILQVLFEDLNQSMSPLKISYHYTSSVTVSSSDGNDWLSQNVRMELQLYAAYNPKISKLVQFLCLSNRRMSNCGICGIYTHTHKRCVTLLQKMSPGVKSHNLPGQGTGAALSTQHCCSRFKSFFIPKDHHT